MKRILFFFNFKNIFISIPLNISDIELKEKDLDIDELENFNIDIWTYLTSEREYKEFTVIGVNLNIIRNDNEEYPYNEDNLYLESNNIGYDDII